MKVAVTRLRDKGRILKRSELPAPILGRLVIDDWGGPGCASKHNRRKAELYVATYSAVDRPAFVPIFDPELIKIDATGMYLQGCEIDSSPGYKAEHVQVWLCVQVNELPTTPE